MASLPSVHIPAERSGRLRHGVGERAEGRPYDVVLIELMRRMMELG